MKFVSSPNDFDQYILDNSRELILIGGDLVYASVDRESLEDVTSTVDENGDAEFIQQNPRSASKSRLFDRSRKQLYLAIKRDAVENAANYNGKVALIADHYLAYGLALKHNTIVIGGAPIVHGLINLEVFIFTDSRLDNVIENRWDGSPFQLEAVLREVFEKHPLHDVHWCSPLPDPPLSDITAMDRFRQVGEEPFKRLVERRIQLRKQGNDESYGFVPALGLLGFAVAVYAVVVGLGYGKLNTARHEFKAEIAGYESAYENSAQSLDQLRYRQELLNKQPEHLDRLRQEDAFLSQVATLPGVLVRSVKFFSPADIRLQASSQGSMDVGNMAVDQFHIEISLPKESDLSARDQAEPVVAMLNNKTGMTVRLVDHTDEMVKVGPTQVAYWKYTLGGASNAAN
ncbi:hypothetical protein [Pseudomonas sp. NPDC096950]|uniref:hypothetical protein n=1 Tax=Pseudomonas sp. NPDC096950 TaxID=3364485 RepID=UPI00383A59BB